MKTIKLPIQNTVNFDNELRLFNSIVRFSYNRFLDGLDEKNTRAEVRNKFLCNSWFLQSAIKEGKSIFEKAKGKKVIFGGRKNRENYLKGLICKDAYRQNKLSPITIQGEKARKGNRLFDFDFLNNKIIYKSSRTNHIEIQLPKFRKNLKREFAQLQSLIDDKKATVTVKFNNEFIWISYDESLIQIDTYKQLKNNRVLGLDLNPNYIGLSVLEFDKNDTFRVLHKQVFGLSLLNVLSSQSSQDKASIYLTNKRQFELVEICHQISNLVNVWKCKKLAIEDLNIKSSDKQKGKKFNRLCNNVWNRNLILNKLRMLSIEHNFDLIEVNCAYSSIVGNSLYGNENTPDMIASSIEIARRAFKKYDKGWFYPVFDVDSLNDSWKTSLTGVKNWIELAKKLKTSGLKYRFQLLDYIQNAVFSRFHKKSKVKLYGFA